MTTSHPGPRVRKLRDEEQANLARARNLIAYQQPWISGALYGYTLVATEGVERHLVDEHGRIYLSAEHLAGLTTTQLGGELLALLWKQLRRHPGRRIDSGAIEQLWDVASELSVNPTVLTPLWRYKNATKPFTFGFDPTLVHYVPADFEFAADLTAEQYYGLLLKLNRDSGGGASDQGDSGDQQEDDGQSQGSGGGSEGDGDGAPGSGSQGGGEGEDSDDESGTASGNGAPSDANDGQGVGSSGDAADTMTGKPITGSGMASRNLTDQADRITDRIPRDRQDSIERQVASNARSHASQGNALPENVEEWSTDVLKPPVISPRDLMLANIGQNMDRARTGTHPTYMRRARRQLTNDPILLKGKAQIRTPVLMGIDVSGSMSDDELIYAASEVGTLARNKGLQVKYFSVSTMPHGLRDLVPGERPILDRDSAGTDMRMAFEVFAIHKARSAVLISDGYTAWPTEVSPLLRKCIVAITAHTREQYEDRVRELPDFLEHVWLPIGDAAA